MQHVIVVLMPWTSLQASKYRVRQCVSSVLPTLDNPSLPSTDASRVRPTDEAELDARFVRRAGERWAGRCARELRPAGSCRGGFMHTEVARPRYPAGV